MLFAAGGVAWERWTARGKRKWVSSGRRGRFRPDVPAHPAARRPHPAGRDAHRIFCRPRDRAFHGRGPGARDAAPILRRHARLGGLGEDRLRGLYVSARRGAGESRRVHPELRRGRRAAILRCGLSPAPGHLGPQQLLVLGVSEGYRHGDHPQGRPGGPSKRAAARSSWPASIRAATPCPTRATCPSTSAAVYASRWPTSGGKRSHSIRDTIPVSTFFLLRLENGNRYCVPRSGACRPSSGSRRRP